MDTQRPRCSLVGRSVLHTFVPVASAKRLGGPPDKGGRRNANLPAAPVSIDPYVVGSQYETIFEGSQIEGALSRRRR